MNVGEISISLNTSRESSTKLSKIQGEYIVGKFRLILNSCLYFGETQIYVNIFVKKMSPKNYRKSEILLNGEFRIKNGQNH